MKKVDLDTYTYSELKSMAKEMGLKVRRSKTELIREVAAAFKEYENYKKDKIDRYTRLGHLGEKGKEGTT